MILPDEDIQKAVDEWLEGKLGEDLRAPYPERNELVAELRDEMHDAFRRRSSAKTNYAAARAITTKLSRWLSTKMCAKASLKTTSAPTAAN